MRKLLILKSPKFNSSATSPTKKSPPIGLVYLIALITVLSIDMPYKSDAIVKKKVAIDDGIKMFIMKI